MIQDIYIIDDDDNLKNITSNIFKDIKEYRFRKVITKQIDIALKNIPSLIIINEDNIKEDIISICKKIKQNDDNIITPVIVVSSNRDKKHRIQILKTCVEHYIISPIDAEYFYYTIVNLLNLLDVNRRVSPLTRTSWKYTNSSRNEKKTS
ncbi:MAG: hypothetical protein IJX34_00500 [Clostridia bacterium]|nr:hypothetical protein [Clostridia bacterium]